MRHPDIGIIALPTEDWGPWFTSRHQVLTRLARHFQIEWLNLVHGWRQIPAIARARWAAPSPFPSPDGMTVRPADLWLPRMYRPAWLGRALLHERMRQARRALVRQGCSQIVVYAWHYDFLPEVQALPRDCHLYHIVDEYSFSETEHPIVPEERNLILTSDQVIVHSPTLMGKKGHLNPRTAMIPNGVDYQAFATPVAEPADIARIPHPRIGYAGFIKQQLDWVLLHELAMAHPKWSWVFVGARHRHPEIDAVLDEMAHLPNVFFLGAKTVNELATYPQHFDVALMPYRATDYTKYIYPLKLHEYLASGTPAIGTAIAALEGFGDVVTLMRDRDRSRWSQAITDALAPAMHTPEARQCRQAVAQRYDWDTLVEQIAALIETRVAERAKQGKPGERPTT